MKTERRSPIITSGVATPSTASNNIAAAITTPASNPASSPAKIAFVVLTSPILRAERRKRNQIACFGEANVRLKLDGFKPSSFSMLLKKLYCGLDGLYQGAETQLVGSATVFAVERIFRTRSTTIEEVTCFMQA